MDERKSVCKIDRKIEINHKIKKKILGMHQEICIPKNYPKSPTMKKAKKKEKRSAKIAKKLEKCTSFTYLKNTVAVQTVYFTN